MAITPTPNVYDPKKIVSAGVGSTPKPILMPTPTPSTGNAFPNYESQSKPPQNVGIPMSSIGTKLETTPAPVQQGASNAVKSTVANINHATPTPTMSNWSTTPDQARQSASEQAAIRIKELLQGGQNAFNTGTTSENNAFKYGNQVTQGNRTLRNATNYAKSDPFQGSTMENNFRQQREDGINDTYTNDQHQNRLNSISQTWQDLQTAAPEKQQALYDQLYQQAAALGIQADQLNAQLQNNQFNQGIAQAGVTGQLPQSMGGGQTQQAQAQQFNQNLQTNQQNQSAQSQQFNQNLQVNEQAYNHARDSLLDSRYAQKFEQDVKQQGFDNAIKIALQQHQISNDNAQLAISQQNANTSAASSANSNNNMKQDNLMNIWKATGKAPDGIPNVTVGTPYAGQTVPKPVVVDPKDSVVAYNHYKDQIDASTYTKAQKQAFAESVKDGMTASDYDKLYNGIT